MAVVPAIIRKGRLPAAVRWFAVAALALGLLGMSLPALAHDITMSVRQFVRAPAAFYQFCAQNSGACRPSGPPVAAIQLTQRRLAELNRVTRSVNHSVTETPDYKQYRREDVWAYPVNGRGDCEDYVLEKRRELLAAGWPSSVLLVTVVRDEKGDGHAILTIPTDRGDLVLDSRTDAIKRWSETKYTFYTRQAANDPRSFVTILSLNPSAEGVAAAEKRAMARADGASASGGQGKGVGSVGNAGGGSRGASAGGSARDNAGSNGNGGANAGDSASHGGNAGGNAGGNSGGAGGGNDTGGGGSSGGSDNSGGGDHSSGGGGNGGGHGNQ